MANAKINPLGDRVVAQTNKAQAKTASGLYIPNNAQEKSKVATVTAVGSRVQGVKVGDKILYKEFSTTDVKLGNEEFILLREEDVLATLS